MAKPELNEYDRKMLGILNGDFPNETWGAWWTPCLEFLSGLGLCTKGPNFQITTEGRRVLGEQSE